MIDSPHAAEAPPSQTEVLLSGLASLAPQIDEAELAHARAAMHRRLVGDDSRGAGRIGRYVVLQRFAEGGMGLVFAAYDAQLDRKVAVKLLRRELSEPSVRTRMVREAQAMAKLNHPNVAQVYEVGEDHGRTFIAMEFIAGETLARWHKSGPTWRAVLEAYGQAGRGLAAAHAAGLVHRDFKPDNAMIGTDGRVRVVDFGLARAEELEHTGEIEPGETAPVEDALRTPLTHAGSIMGTPAYMAPEQLAGADVDAKADQFGFCVALWEGLFGTRPFTGATRSALAANVAAGRIHEPPRDSQVPGWVRAVLQRGLSVAPEDRYPSMHALLAALDRDPSRRRRRVTLAIVGVGVAASVLGVSALDRSQRARDCATEAASLDATWNADTRASVRDALLGVGPGYAASTVARVVPELDAWAAAWSAEREHNCRALRIDRTRTEAIAGRASECLDEGREAFVTLVDTLGAADESVLQSAAISSQSLPTISACADEGRLQRRTVDADETTRATASALLRRLAAAEVLLNANRRDEALAAGEAALVEAESLGTHTARARALRFVAMAHAALTDHARAASLAEEAVVMAMRVGDDELTFDAIEQLIGELHETGARDRATWWTVPAGAIVERLGEADDLRGAALLDSRALLAADPVEAVALYRQALAIRERRLGPDHPHVGTSVSNVGTALERSGGNDEAKAFHERGLAIREQALGPDHPQVANSLINAAQMYTASREFPRALELTTRALEIWERGLGPDHRNCALALGNMAAIHMYMDDHASARPLLERAVVVVERAHGVQSPFLVQHLLNLGIIAQRRKDLDEAVRLFGRGLEVAEAWGGPNHLLVASPLGGLSEIDLIKGDTRSAVARLERALAIHERMPQDRPNLAHTRYALARALRDDPAQRRRAIELAESAIAEYRALDGDWSGDISAIEQWLADLQRSTPQ